MAKISDVENIVEEFKNEVKKLDEFEYFHSTEHYTGDKNGRIDVNIQFEREGDKIFRPRCGVEDDDYPDYVGASIINPIIRNALGVATDITPRVQVEEKGYLTVMFEYDF